VPQDTDGDLDFYDARVGGGFPEPPLPAPPCSGDSCQGPPSVAPPGADPVSSAFRGAGNLASPRKAAKRCRKGQRKARSGGRVRCVKRNRANRNRRASR
jgi:hypothetical protein